MQNTMWLCSVLGATLMLNPVRLGWTQEERERTDIQSSAQSSAFELTTQYDISDADLTCEQANRITRRAVERLRYTVASFTPASVEKAGEIKATRIGSWEEHEPVTVHITCGTDGVHIAPRPAIPPCEQANRLMYRAVERLGYQVVTYIPATFGKTGLVKGERSGKEPIAVTVTCYTDRNRVAIETSMDSPLVASADFYRALSDFQRGFFAMFKAATAELGYEKVQTLGQGDHVQVVMIPLDKTDTLLTFGTEMTQVVAVRLEVSNPTKHAYLLEADKIVLLAASGARIKPISEQNTSLPIPALTNRSIDPGTYVEGYLYYPPGTYTGARGYLVEQNSQEREGFSLQF